MYVETLGLSVFTLDYFFWSGQVITHLELSHVVELTITINTLVPLRINPHVLIIRLGKTIETYLIMSYGYACNRGIA